MTWEENQQLIPVDYFLNIFEARFLVHKDRGKIILGGDDLIKNLIGVEEAIVCVELLLEKMQLRIEFYLTSELDYLYGGIVFQKGKIVLL